MLRSGALKGVALPLGNLAMWSGTVRKLGVNVIIVVVLSIEVEEMFWLRKGWSPEKGL